MVVGVGWGRVGVGVGEGEVEEKWWGKWGKVAEGDGVGN